ncbi:MAG: NAD(P)-binding domain-containing protein [Burkholderiales bacterium]
MSDSVGIIGVGLMGQAFSHHLLQSGFKVQGFDLDERRLAQLHERGGTPVESPAAAARGARWLITSLPTSDIVREVILGPKGVAEGHVRTSLKDARLALEQGARLGVPMHVGKLWAELQQAAYEQGLADFDSSAFIEVLRGKAGLPRWT